MKEKPNYGMDAPDIVRRWGCYGILGFIALILSNTYLPGGWLKTLVVFVASFIAFRFLMPAITIPLGSLFFKFNDREWLFKNLALAGTENVLDVGCGHGLLLVGAAKRLQSGKAYGLDLWAQEDQASNSKESTLRNAEIENVNHKVEIHDGDMRAMPFQDATFDAVVSSWAIHNIYDKNEREKALAEIIRVLKPEGKLAILDIDHAPSYRDFFASQGLKNTQLLGPRFTFGNRTYLVLATK